MRTVKLALVVLAVTSGPLAHAETVSDYIKDQKALERLDYQIERYDRLVKIKEAQHKLDTVGEEDRSSGSGNGGNTQMQYFPAQQGGNGGQGDPTLAAQERKTAEERQREAKQQARLAELNMLNNASIVEVFRKQGRGSAYGAVLKLNNGITEVEPGDMVSNWKVTRISLNEVTLENQKYEGVVRNIKQIQ